MKTIMEGWKRFVNEAMPYHEGGWLSSLGLSRIDH